MPRGLPAPCTATRLAKNYISATRIHRLLFKEMNLRKSVLLDLDFRFTEFYEVRPQK
jgi:hypothetical protein